MATPNDIAFVVGLDHYLDSPLSSCANDAEKMADLLGQNGDSQQTQNFSVSKLIPGRAEDMPTRAGFLDEFSETLAGLDEHDFLFYFSGHGSTNDWGTEIILNAANNLTESVAMDELLTLINQSRVRQAIVMLDCCFAGTFASSLVLAAAGTGRRGFIKAPAVIRPNLMVLAAARGDQAALAGTPYSAFTELLIAGLEGGAADFKGQVSAQGLFGYAAPAFGPLDQRPNFKANMTVELALRTVDPRVDLAILRRLKNHFAAGAIVLNPGDVPADIGAPAGPEQQRYVDLLELREAGFLRCPNYRHLSELASDGATIELSAAGRQAFMLATRDKI